MTVLTDLIPAGRRSGDDLTARELDVLRLVAAGYSTAAIARQLVIAEETVKKHVLRMTARLGARNRAHAVALAIRGGILAT